MAAKNPARAAALCAGADAHRPFRAWTDKVTGLDSGADYYLTKPFESEELLACVRALTRKQGGGTLDNAL